jgi:hypothetical protein
MSSIKIDKFDDFEYSENRKHSQSSLDHGTFDQEDIIYDSEYIKRYFDLNMEVKSELERVSSLDFDVFKIREQTKDNELVTTVSFILAKEGIF